MADLNAISEKMRQDWDERSVLYRTTELALGFACDPPCAYLEASYRG